MIVNVKVANIRPRYNDLREWMEDPNNVYIGRRGVVFITDSDGSKKRFPPSDSLFANPFPIGKLLNEEEERTRVIGLYEVYMREKLRRDPELLSYLLSLKGKVLGCWCKPKRCHGDVLLQLIDEFSR